MAIEVAAEAMESIERRRAELQANQDAIRKSLNEWVQWELDYETLKEEIQQAGSPSPAQMAEIGRTVCTDRVNEDLVEDLLGRDRETKRDANQVVDLISKRLNYVQQNITTLEKQLNRVEQRTAGASLLLEPDLENEEGLPLMDIVEELDEEGNVLSSTVNQPGKAAPEIVQALRKTGSIQPEQGSTKTKDVPSSAATAETEATVQTNPSTNGRKVEAAASSPKKSVSFASDTKEDPPAMEPDGLTALRTHGYNERLADYNFTRGTKVIEVDEDDNEIAQYPIIPQDESPESAQLRRQMLQYGLSEVGQVVAEIDLQTPRVEYSDEEEDEYDEDEDSEGYDEYGRSLRPVITDEYRREMMELEKKLNARMMENVGPRTDIHPLANYADDVKKLVIAKDEPDLDANSKSEPSTKQSDSKKKGVRFADSLDISPAPQVPKEQNESRDRVVPVPTMSNTIVERAGQGPQPRSPGAVKSAKMSQFRSARLGSPAVQESRSVPQGPSAHVLASSVVEHVLEPSEPLEPDEFDPVIIKREVEQQYQKMRSKFIAEQGGFDATEEDENPIVEEKDGKMKKVSRFRAARLKADGM
ncbi:hypothetical protein EJ04DRAFT_504108 [Polyplosphaeria fusca]|uniref:DUF3835 domain-containing protein n=1 Tax=Polyplosphaeria fusca TaxID=682080 RepID=A0A9P4UVP1_9PLEO|nr:hypothetical protein EJ04DRAFT_504108 [Polyplosphaeria fusca]